MALLTRATSLAIAVCLGGALAGCANDGAGMFGATTTASIPEKPKVDPACVTLTSQIGTLRQDGIAEKVEKAAAKKYKMTTTDLAKAAELNKANAEFQIKCSATSVTAAMTVPAGASAATSGTETRQARAQPTVSSSSPVTSGNQ